jgi:hypothetical protein
MKPFAEICRTYRGRCALLVVLAPPHSRDLTRLARSWCSAGNYQPVVMFCNPPGYSQAAVDALDNSDIAWFALGAGLPGLRPLLRALWRSSHWLWLQLPLVLLFAIPGMLADAACSLFRFVLPAKASRKLCLGVRLVRILGYLALTRSPLGSLGLLQLLATLRDTYKHLWWAYAMFTSLRPRVLLMAEDNVSFISALLIKVGHEYGTPSVLVPYTVASVAEFKESLVEDPEHSMRFLFNRVAAHYYPRWCTEYKERRFLRAPGYQIQALEWLGLAPAKPWVPNYGDWDVLAAESQAMLARYLALGLPPEKLFVTGAASDDILAKRLFDARSYREELYSELGLPPNRPLLLCALPPDQLHMKRPGCEFSRYEELIEFLVRSLGSVPGFNAVLSLHPRTPRGVLELVRSLKATVSPRDTLELVALSDIYIASVSATIRWAITCGVPVLNYDVYRYEYDDYDAAPGVLKARTSAEYLSTLKRLISDPSYAAQVRASQAECASAWGHRDGRSGRRLVSLLDQLTGPGDSRGALQAPHGGKTVPSGLARAG